MVSGTSRLKYRLVRVALAVAALTALLVAAHRPLLVGFAELFRVDDPAPSDALILMLGGNADRPRKAADLFRRGTAPVILMGSDPDTEMDRRMLLDRGVPARAIRVLGPVRSTHDEAEQVAAYARAHALRRLTLVTTAHHTGRARRALRRALRGTGVEVRAAASRADGFDEWDWYRTPAGRTAYLSELGKSLYYWVVY